MALCYCIRITFLKVGNICSSAEYLEIIYYSMKQLVNPTMLPNLSSKKAVMHTFCKKLKYSV